MSGDRARESAFFTCVGSAGQADRALLLMESIRAFGGELSDRPFWVIEASPEGAPCAALADAGAVILPMSPSASLGDYLFARKVAACATAEERADGSVDTLMWLIPECLVLRPPLLLELPPALNAAVRPVHIRNVGLPAAEPPDAFWRGVFSAVGEPPESFTVESFVEGEHIRPYFNSAAFAVDPAVGLMRRWLTLYETMVADDGFQREACGDESHRIFLHQAILSALIATRLDRESIRELPPDYGYPYNLHGSVPPERRVRDLADTTVPIYEERPVDPREVDDVEIREPLRSWLLERTGGMKR